MSEYSPLVDGPPRNFHSSPVTITIPLGEPKPVEAVHRQIAEAMAKDEWLIPSAIRIHPEHWVRVRMDPEIMNCINHLGGKAEFSGLALVFDPSLPRGQYYDFDGTLRNQDGTRSIFDDVEK